MEKLTLKERASKKLEAWKKDVDELKHQLGHTGEDAKIAFEKEKKVLVKWIDEAKNKFEKLEDISESKTKVLQGKLEELRVQAALGKAEAEDSLYDQQKKLRHNIHNARVSISKLEKEAKGNAKTLLNASNQSLEKYQTKFDMFQLQLMDDKEGAVQFLHDKKKDISLRLNKMSSKLEKGKEAAADRWEHFSEELSEAWDHLKKAINS